MDNQSLSSSKRTLPNTPRVNNKIMEYYNKFGHGRDLEKFMRLYSPASSQESQKTHEGITDGTTNVNCCKDATVSNCSCCDLELKLPRPLSVCGAGNSKSLPNIDVQGQSVCKDREYFPAKDVIVDINAETESGGEKEKIVSASTENLETPKKILKCSKTQTPESVTKSHRRLEWDSLGDIGYQKSMSTSNISVLEKSLLEAFFKDNSVISKLVTSAQSKSDKAEHRNSLKEHKVVEVEHSTPPLACSTLVESKKEGDKPKLTKSTSSTSLQEKFEKYAQTSLRELPTVHSKEIQCSMSASSGSIKEGTATPSSFEYYSSTSSKFKSSHSSDNLSQQLVNPIDHPFIKSITELLMKRKVLSEKNQCKEQQYNKIRDLQAKFKAALDENKENHSHFSSNVSSTTTSSFSLTKHAPELDLGIQLICSLIDAKSVNCRQKKQLIRDIVKRLTRLEIQGHTNHSSTTTTHSSSGTTTQYSNDSKPFHLYDSVHSNIFNNQQSNMYKTKSGTELVIIPTLEKQVPVNNTEVQEKHTNSYNTSENSKNHPDKASKLKTSGDETPRQIQQKKNHSVNQSPCKRKDRQCENILNESKNNLVKSATDVESKQNTEALKEKSSPVRLVPDNSKTITENKTHRSTQTNPFSKLHKKLSLTSTYASSSSTSQDLTTQKCIGTTKNELNNSNTDADQPTMREWLNPLTQSEIEYEEKKHEENRKKAAAIQKEKLLKNSRHDCGRVQQLNWIESEIKRLECLKHLLLKDVTTEQSSTNLSSHDFASCSEKNFTKNSTQTDKLYDTVYSDKSSVLSESAERLVQEIEIILEESREDVINIKDNLKKSKDRKKEIQIVYEKENTFENNIGKVLKPKFRSITETISINEKQLLNGQNEEMENKQRRQREKIDTPSTEKSQESESIKDMVQQRKKDFIKAYKIKKQHHYEALKQQQKENFRYLHQERKPTERAATITSATTNTDHYSVPHTMPRTFSANELSYAYTRNPLPLIPLEKERKTQNYKPKNHHIIYSTAAAKQPDAKPLNNATTTTATTTSSSSTSILCASSDVSVPMGSCTTSTTATTTHQYDDVAAAAAVTGIAVQTSDSMMCTKPLYGPKQTAAIFIPYNKSTTSTKSNTACIQVKPKSIAYVIEFEEDNKLSNTNTKSSNSATDTKGCLLANTEATNSLKTLLDTEPQLTLQEHLEKSKPKFLQHSKERKAILNQLKCLRQERYHQLREIIDNASFNSLEKRLDNLPPPPTQKLRVFNTKEMKALTNKRFTALTEVVAKQDRETEERKRKSNRILRDIFSRRLQKRVLSGKLSRNHSRTVI